VLILSRRMDESIIIGEEVTITVLSIKGKQVRLGINAPDEVSVHREEIYKMIKKEESIENQSSGNTPSEHDNED